MLAFVSPYLMTSLRLAAWLVILCTIFIPLERATSTRLGNQPIRNWANQLAYYFANGLLVSAILSVPFALLVVAGQRLLGADWQIMVSALPLWLKLLLGFLLGEIGFYWGHRLSHRSPLLWRFHSIHHESPSLSFLANTRAHPMDLIFARLCGFAPLYLLGLAGDSGSGSMVPLALIVLSTVWAFLLHAHVRWRFGWLEAVVATPAFHHWHHSLHGQANVNFAAMLPLLDRLFGSHHLPPHWPEAYGIQERLPAGFLAQLLYPLKRF